MTTPLDLKALQIFVIFCQHMNMTVTAKDCKMTQSAVSQQIRQLEERLGARLLDREMRPMKLTAAGRLLRNQGQALLRQAEITTTMLQQHGGQALPRLVLGTTGSFADICLPRLVKTIEPKVNELALRCDNSPDLAQALLNREIDIAICHENLSETSCIEQHIILKEPFVVLYPKSLEKEGKDLRLQQIAKSLPFIALPRTSNLGRHIESFLRARGISIGRRMEVSRFVSKTSMIEAGIGWTITTPLMLVLSKQRAQLKNCKITTLPSPGLKRTISLLAHKDELGKLPLEIANITRKILKESCYKDMQRLCACVESQVCIPAV